MLLLLLPDYSCPLIVRRSDTITYPWPDGQYPWLCTFAQPAVVQPSLDWQIDPAYYGYAGCVCAQVSLHELAAA